MHRYFNDNLPSSSKNVFKSLAEPNKTKSNQLERVLNKNLESFSSAMFPKLWNAIEIDLQETKSAKIFKERVISIYLENYERCQLYLHSFSYSLGDTLNTFSKLFKSFHPPPPPPPLFYSWQSRLMEMLQIEITQKTWQLVNCFKCLLPWFVKFFNTKENNKNIAC